MSARLYYKIRRLFRAKNGLPPVGNCSPRNQVGAMTPSFAPILWVMIKETRLSLRSMIPFIVQ